MHKDAYSTNTNKWQMDTGNIGKRISQLISQTLLRKMMTSEYRRLVKTPVILAYLQVTMPLPSPQVPAYNVSNDVNKIETQNNNM
jgi:hypothetical protein